MGTTVGRRIYQLTGAGNSADESPIVMRMGAPVLSKREDSEALVQKHFGRQLAACQSLLELSWELLGATPWRGRPHAGVVDTLIASEAGRSMKTYRAALGAARGGFGPQAEMLNRVLFESMAVAHWTRAHPELAAQRFGEHARHNRSLWNRRLVARSWIDEPLTDLPDAEEQRRLDKLFGEWGDKLWCGLSVHQFVESIEHEWAEGHSRIELRDFYAIAHATNNETLHGSVSSLAGGVITNDETTLEIDAGPSLSRIQPALFGAFWTYGNLLSVVFEHMEIEGRERLDELSTRNRPAFIQIDPTVARKTGRNDPCPCGSGAKFKRCHGA